ncbi:MAG TPA: GtrA family protein [Candidatus Udaeobacter sp.]|nr:GtrA family protein [Candidatus Udaeobacter sp.]
MFKKTFLHFWSMRDQFIRYFVIGIGAVILDVGSLYLLKEYLHLRPVVAVIINGLFLFNYVFFLNKYWAFKSTGITHKQVIRFLILAGINYLISITWMYIFNHQLGFNYLWVRVANIALSVAWNFLLYRHWVYKTDQAVSLAN